MTQASDKDQAIAIAYITGQATPADKAEFRARFAESSEFRRMVRDLEIWLAPLSAELPDAEPPAGLLTNIMADIDRYEALAPTSHSDTPPRRAANDNRVRLWKGVAALSAFVAILSLSAHFIPSAPLTSEPETITAATSDPMLAILQDDAPTGLVAIVYNPQTNEIVARFDNISKPSEGDFQLWRIRADTGAPVSLGVIAMSETAEDGGKYRLNVGDIGIMESDMIAISLERAGGSTQAGPEGPVLYTGSPLRL